MFPRASRDRTHAGHRRGSIRGSHLRARGPSPSRDRRRAPTGARRSRRCGPYHRRRAAVLWRRVRLRAWPDVRFGSVSHGALAPARPPAGGRLAPRRAPDRPARLLRRARSAASRPMASSRSWSMILLLRSWSMALLSLCRISSSLSARAPAAKPLRQARTRGARWTLRSPAQLRPDSLRVLQWRRPFRRGGWSTTLQALHFQFADSQGPCRCSRPRRRCCRLFHPDRARWV